MEVTKFVCSMAFGRARDQGTELFIHLFYKYLVSTFYADHANVTNQSNDLIGQNLY